MKSVLNKENLQKIGVLAKPHGVWGEVLVRFLPEFSSKNIDPKWLFIEIDGGVVPFNVISSKDKGNDAIVVKLETIDSEKSAKTYQGFNIFVNPEDIIISENSYKTEAGIYKFINYTVFDKKHGNIGIVQEIIDIQQNPVLVVFNNEKEILIPFQNDFITSIDTKKKELHIEVPKGLIELYL